MAVLRSFLMMWSLQAKRQIASAASCCLGSSGFGCNLAVGPILDFGHCEVWGLPHHQAAPEDRQLLLALLSLAGDHRLPAWYWLLWGNRPSVWLRGSFLRAWCAWGLVPLASLPVVCYFSLEVLEGPIWFFLCTDKSPLFSISFMFSPVTCSIADRFTRWTGEVRTSSVFSQNSQPNEQVSMRTDYAGHCRHSAGIRSSQRGAFFYRLGWTLLLPKI